MTLDDLVDELDHRCHELYDEGYEDEAFYLSDLATRLRMYLRIYSDTQPADASEQDNDRTY